MANPYESVLDDEKESIRPSYYRGDSHNDNSDGIDIHGEPKNEKHHSSHTASDRQNSARENLSNLENSASTDSAEKLNSENSGSSDSKSENTAHKFENKVTGAAPIPAPAKLAFKGKGKKLRRFGPLGAIGALLVGAALVIFAAQSLLPFSLSEVLKGAFDTVIISKTYRAHIWFKNQLDPDRHVSEATKTTIFGEEKFKLTKKQKAGLRAQGIDVIEGVELKNGKKLTVLLYTDDAGNRSIICADPKYANDIRKASFDGDKNPVLKEFRQNTTGKFEVTDIQTKVDNDSVFHKIRNAAFATWKSSTASWFNKRTGDFLKRWGLTRDLFHDFKNTAKQTLADIRGKISERLKGGEGSSKYKGANGEDENGNKTEGDSGEDKISASDFGESKEKARSKVGSLAKSYADKIGGKTSAIDTLANGVCGVAGFVGAMSLMAAASEAQQFMTLALAYLEAIDKTKAGSGTEAPMTELVNTLTWDSELKDVDDNVVRTGNAMQAVGIQSAYGDAYASSTSNDASMRKYNPSSMLHDVLYGKGGAGGVLAHLGTTAEAFAGCQVAKIGTALVSGTVEVAELIACLTGVGCIAKLVDFGISVAAGVGIALTLENIVAPLVADWMYGLFKTEVTNVIGEDLGNVIFDGTSNVMGGMARSNGQHLSNANTYNKYVGLQQSVQSEIAFDARSNLSPFDISSEYTFFGSIFRSLGSSMSSSSDSSIITSVARATAASLTSLLPGAHADSTLIAASTKESCPELDSIGAVCNVGGLPNTITDPNTANYDPAEIIDKVQDNTGGDLDFSGDNPTVSDGDISDNEVAKYILFCENRDSSFGFYDQNIADTIASGGSSGNTLADATKYSIPVAGNVVSIFEDAKVASNADYVSGEACVAGSKAYNDRGNAWIARFEEDQQLAQSMGLIEQTTADAFLEEWYEDHPLDNSLEGVLARTTGLRKDTVVAILDQAEAIIALSEYDPTGLGPSAPQENAPALAGAPEENDITPLLLAERNAPVAHAPAAYTIVYLAQSPPKRPSTLDRQDAKTSMPA